MESKAEESIPTPEEMGQKIRDAREAAGVTQAGLADKIHSTQAQIARYESGEQDMTVIRFLQIAQALGIDPGELISED